MGGMSTGEAARPRWLAQPGRLCLSLMSSQLTQALGLWQAMHMSLPGSTRRR